MKDLECNIDFTDNLLNQGFTKDYNKAIDDYKYILKEELNKFNVKNIDTCVLFDLCERITEQLKKGGANDKR